MEALLISEPKKATVEMEEVGTCQLFVIFPSSVNSNVSLPITQSTTMATTEKIAMKLKHLWSPVDEAYLQL